MKQIVILIAIFILALSAVHAQTASGSQLAVSLVNQIPDPVEPGDTVDVRLKIENEGSANARNVEIRVPDVFPFQTVDPASGIKDVGSIQGLQTGDVGAIARFTLTVDQSASEGQATIEPEYRIDGGPWIQAGTFSISIQSQDAILYVNNVQTLPDRLVPGQEGTVSVDLTNLADSLLKDITVKLALGPSEPFTPIDGTNKKVIKTLRAGQSDSVAFSLLPDADATASVYKVGLEVNYLDELGNSYSSNNTIGLVVDKEPEYSIGLEDTTVFTRNANGDVVVSLSNVGPTNIKFLTIKLVENDNYQVVSVPSVYIGNLESDDFETAEFSIHTEDGNPGAVPLQFELHYKDDFNKDFVKVESVPLQLYSGSEARSLGLVTNGANPVQIFFGLAIQVIVLVFVVFMLVDLAKNPMPKYKKVLWTILNLTVLGAVLYYFIARRKKR